MMLIEDNYRFDDKKIKSYWQKTDEMDNKLKLSF